MQISLSRQSAHERFMEMLHSLNALAGKISPQTDSNANKVVVTGSQLHHHNNNHPYSKPAPATNGRRASPEPANDSA